jgi:hypothetical protein
MSRIFLDHGGELIVDGEGAFLYGLPEGFLGELAHPDYAPMTFCNWNLYFASERGTVEGRRNARLLLQDIENAIVHRSGGRP